MRGALILKIKIVKKISLGFTLVELIVVITIVSILSTVGFVSYSWYLTGARDSSRISQMTRLIDSLQVYSTNKSLPLPDDSITITASWTLVAYQWYVGVDVLETIDYTNGGKDPKDESYYSYFLTRSRTNLQLLAFMEEEWSVSTSLTSSANAADYTERFPKTYGRKLGILTQSNTNTPAQEVLWATSLDLVTESESYVAHITDSEKIEGAGAQLQAVIPNANCKRIRQTWGGNSNGAYRINPGGTWEVEVYCDMETAWGGWTLVARSHAAWAFSFNILSDLGSISEDSAPYTLDTSNLSYTKKMIAPYTTGKLITDYKTEVDASSDLQVDTHTLWVLTIVGGWWVYEWNPWMILVK